MSIQHDVKDLSLADAGRESIEWADRQMPVLALTRERFERDKPLQGVRLAACLHVTITLVQHCGVSSFAICDEDNVSRLLGRRHLNAH